MLLLPELLLLLCRLTSTCLRMLSRILLPALLLLLLCCLGCTCSGHKIPTRLPLPLLPLRVLS